MQSDELPQLAQLPEELKVARERLDRFVGETIRGCSEDLEGEERPTPCQPCR